MQACADTWPHIEIYLNQALLTASFPVLCAHYPWGSAMQLFPSFPLCAFLQHVVTKYNLTAHLLWSRASISMHCFSVPEALFYNSNHSLPSSSSCIKNEHIFKSSFYIQHCCWNGLTQQLQLHIPQKSSSLRATQPRVNFCKCQLALRSNQFIHLHLFQFWLNSKSL